MARGAGRGLVSSVRSPEEALLLLCVAFWMEAFRGHRSGTFRMYHLKCPLNAPAGAGLVSRTTSSPAERFGTLRSEGRHPREVLGSLQRARPRVELPGAGWGTAERAREPAGLAGRQREGLDRLLTSSGPVR